MASPSPRIAVGVYTASEVAILRDLAATHAPGSQFRYLVARYNQRVPSKRQRTISGLRRKCKSLGIQFDHPKKKEPPTPTQAQFDSDITLHRPEPGIADWTWWDMVSQHPASNCTPVGLVPRGRLRRYERLIASGLPTLMVA